MDGRFHDSRKSVRRLGADRKGLRDTRLPNCRDCCRVRRPITGDAFPLKLPTNSPCARTERHAHEKAKTQTNARRTASEARAEKELHDDLHQRQTKAGSATSNDRWSPG